MYIIEIFIILVREREKEREREDQITHLKCVIYPYLTSKYDISMAQVSNIGEGSKFYK